MRGRDSRLSRGNRDGSRRGGFNRGRGFNRGSFGRAGFRGDQSGLGFSGSRDGNRYNSDNQRHRMPKNDSPGQRLSEDQIGVTQYMSEHEGFNGIIKARYSDFQVSEINLQGEVAQLTTLSPPEPPADDKVEEDEELSTKYNVDILPIEQWDEINKVAVGADMEPVEIDVTTSTKEERTKIHEAVKKAFGDSIVGSTFNTDDKKFVRFEKYKKGVRIDTRVKWTWPGEYVYFMVHKENCDTMDAAAKIAERLRSHIKPSMIGYAGTKDRRAKTTQWFSIRKMNPKRIANACRGMRELHVGNYSFHPHHLKLGMLLGNRFRIALRNVTADDAVVEAACSLLRERGFINYYGLQRFGTRAQVPTFDIGLKLLKGNFQEAIDAILSEREGPLQEALTIYRVHGPAAACSALPRHTHTFIEARLLHALAEKPNDLQYALQRIPRNTRLLYLHSYQSLVWNRSVSERIRRHGLDPAPGDFVLAHSHRITEEIDDEESDNEETQENTENSKETVETIQTTDNVTKNNTNTKKIKEKVPVKVLTQEDVDSKSYTIFDVIMPLPGHFIEYPPNMLEYYQSLLNNDGLKLELRHRNKSYCLSGAYRHVAVRPGAMSCQHVRYTDPHDELILSDLDLMSGASLPSQHEGEYKAVVVTFSLPPSCYATMALRELLRADTSGSSQAAGNDYHKRRGDAPHRGGEKRPRDN